LVLLQHPVELRHDVAEDCCTERYLAPQDPGQTQVVTGGQFVATKNAQLSLVRGEGDGSNGRSRILA
jgi:hypothetical protein